MTNEGNPPINQTFILETQRQGIRKRMKHVCFIWGGKAQGGFRVAIIHTQLLNITHTQLSLKWNKVGFLTIRYYLWWHTPKNHPHNPELAVDKAGDWSLYLHEFILYYLNMFRKENLSPKCSFSKPTFFLENTLSGYIFNLQKVLI